jgi:RNA polymerase sigma-70 factor (ECF subfamily)
MIVRMDRSAEMALTEAAWVADTDQAGPAPSESFRVPAPGKRTKADDASGRVDACPEAAADARTAAGDPASAVPLAGKPDLAGAVEAAQRGDEDAFRTLYRDMQPRLLRYLRAMVGEDAEDVASESWLQIARDLPAFSGDSDGFRGWAATIARHRAMDHQRRHRRRPPPATTPIEDLADMAGHDDTAASALDAVSTDAAVALIAELPRDQAEAVLLRVVVGLDAEHAGKVLGKRAGAVRTAAYRGLRKLARRLEQAAAPRDADAAGGWRSLPRLALPPRRVTPLRRVTPAQQAAPAHVNGARNPGDASLASPGSRRPRPGSGSPGSAGGGRARPAEPGREEQHTGSSDTNEEPDA